jgi:trans-aconitate 2-methyltransferase
VSDWSPERYTAFEKQRLKPFLDLIDLLPRPLAGRMVDLGCGHGRPTRIAAETLGFTDVTAVDSSPAMLERAAQEGSFAIVEQTIEEWLATDSGGWDLVLANAALHWVDDHEVAFPALLDHVGHGGWMAVHIPVMQRAPSHALMEVTARTPAFSDWFVGYAKTWPQRDPSFYEGALATAGFTHTVVETRTYRHPMPGPDAIAAWTRSTALRPWLARLSADQIEPFVAAYTAALDRGYPPCDASGQRLLDYRRLLMVGRRP